MRIAADPRDADAVAAVAAIAFVVTGGAAGPAAVLAARRAGRCWGSGGQVRAPGTDGGVEAAVARIVPGGGVAGLDGLHEHLQNLGE